MQDTRPNAFVFVLTPFHNSFDEVYQLGIRILDPTGTTEINFGLRFDGYIPRPQ